MRRRKSKRPITATHVTTAADGETSDQPASTNGESATKGGFFGEARATPEEASLTDPFHDKQYQKVLHAMKSKSSLVKPIPPVRKEPPIIDLAEVLPGSNIGAINRAGQVVFHSVGNTGNTKDAGQQALAPDRMVEDRFCMPSPFCMPGAPLSAPSAAPGRC
jgi:hypothetical protein